MSDGGISLTRRSYGAELPADPSRRTAVTSSSQNPTAQITIIGIVHHQTVRGQRGDRAAPFRVPHP
jgi:hypothetical protein